MQLPNFGHITIPDSVLQAGKDKRKADQSTIFLADVLRESLASNAAAHLTDVIQQFDEDLSENEEVGMRLVAFGQTIVFHVTSLGYQNPNFILLNGLMQTGERVQLVQHVSQLSFLLMTLPCLDPSQPRKRFGFDQSPA